MAAIVHQRIQNLVKQIKCSNRCIRVDVNYLPSKCGHGVENPFPSDGVFVFFSVGVHQVNGDSQDGVLVDL
eukprot:1264954-Karenia_brevis.AAC.1